MKNNRSDLGGQSVVIEPRFKLIPFEQLHPSPEPAYLIKGLLPRVGLAVVWGPPKCGKSFWTIDAMLHVALGWPYRGRKVIQGAVVYCAFEGQDGYGKRAEAFRQRRLAEGADPVPFYLVATRMSFVKDHTKLIGAIGLQLCGIPTGRPVAVVLDTLNRSLDGSESKDEDMGAYVRAGDAVREAFNCLVIIVHHCGIEGTRPRGHTSLTGAVDAQLAVKRDGAGNVVATVEWMKDGPEGETIVSRWSRSRLEPIMTATQSRAVWSNQSTAPSRAPRPIGSYRTGSGLRSKRWPIVRPTVASRLPMVLASRLACSP